MTSEMKPPPGMGAAAVKTPTLGDGTSNDTTPTDSTKSLLTDTAKPLPWYKQHAADITTKRDFSPAELGVYVRLITAQWEARGPIPGDDKTLAKIAGCDVRYFRKIRTKVLHACNMYATCVLHECIREQLHACTATSAKRSAAANKRWHRDDASASENDEKSDANAYAPSSCLIEGLGVSPLRAENPEKSEAEFRAFNGRKLPKAGGQDAS